MRVTPWRVGAFAQCRCTKSKRVRTKYCTFNLPLPPATFTLLLPESAAAAGELVHETTDDDQSKSVPENHEDDEQDMQARTTTRRRRRRTCHLRVMTLLRIP